MNFNFSTQSLLFCLFGCVIVTVLLLDLGIFQKKDTPPSYKSSLAQLAMWFLMALSFGAVLFYYEGPEVASQFVTGYLMEWSLSADNIFVFILILSFFSIPEKNHSRVLFWGIIGAIIFRGVFILAGSTLVQHFSWILYLFGILLVYTGIKMLGQHKQEEAEYNPEKNQIYKFLTRNFNFSEDVKASQFIVIEDGKRLFTPLMLVVCLIAATDVMFAIDSIPAVFAISQNKLVIYSSNVFAVMGLRSLFYILNTVISKFRFLPIGISLILIFIGVKMLIEYFHIHVNSFWSLSVIVVFLGGSMLLSQIIKEKS